MRVRDGVVSRLLRVGESPVLVRAWEPGRQRVVAARRAGRSPARWPRRARCRRCRVGPPARPSCAWRSSGCASRSASTTTSREFYRRFRRDPLLGPLLRRRPWLRPRRRPWAWEALAWAVVKQLIESERAARIQRRIVGRWGSRLGREREALRDVPGAATIAGRAPAELAAMDLSPGRSIALRAVAREIAAGRCESRRARPPTGACSRSPRSAPGPCSAWGCSVAATPTRCRPATWST